MWNFLVDTVFLWLLNFRKQMLDWSLQVLWQPDWQVQELVQRYRPFGLIEEGDTVIVEDEPVIQNGVVLEKGRVRKQRS